MFGDCDMMLQKSSLIAIKIDILILLVCVLDMVTVME